MGTSLPLASCLSQIRGMPSRFEVKATSSPSGEAVGDQSLPLKVRVDSRMGDGPSAGDASQSLAANPIIARSPTTPSHRGRPRMGLPVNPAVSGVVMTVSVPLSTSSRTMRASAMSCRRWRAFLLRQRCSNMMTEGCKSSGRRSQSGSVLRMAARVSERVSPGKAGRPVSISNKTQPKAQMSVRLSTALPRVCSGLM